MDSCPFMAIQSALDKSASLNRDKTLSCPFSGKQAIFGGGSFRSSEDSRSQPANDEEESDHHISQWMRQVPRSGSPLGAISEDIEHRVPDDHNERSFICRHSLGGSLRSLDSVVSGLRDQNTKGSSRSEIYLNLITLVSELSSFLKNVRIKIVTSIHA